MNTSIQVDPHIWDKVRNAFAVALGLEDDEVTLDARLLEDLDAESLDFLDIAFRLERAFDIKIPRGGIETSAREDVEGIYEVEGVLTEQGLAILMQLMPEVPREEFRPGLRVAEVPVLFRVATFYNIVVHLLEEKQRQALEPMSAVAGDRAVV